MRTMGFLHRLNSVIDQEAKKWEYDMDQSSLSVLEISIKHVYLIFFMYFVSFALSIGVYLIELSFYKKF